jgi:hypothetical protein
MISINSVRLKINLKFLQNSFIDRAGKSRCLPWEHTKPTNKIRVPNSLIFNITAGGPYNKGCAMKVKLYFQEW